jgi:hypothetical protein
MAERIVAKIASGAQLPDLIERQFNYPAYTYELMFGCTGGDFTPRPVAARVHGPVPARTPGLARQPGAVDGLYLCGAGCHGGPGVTFIPGYNCGYAVLEAVERPVVADLALHEGQIDIAIAKARLVKRLITKKIHGPLQAPPPPSTMVHSGQEHHVDDGVVLGRRVRRPVGEQGLGVVDVGGRWPYWWV